MSKRVSIALIAVVALIGGLFFFMQDGGSDRGSRSSERARDAARNSKVSVAEKIAQAGDVADAATVAKLIERFGGFETRGRLFLSKPTAPGENLTVVLSADFDGTKVEGRVETDSEGRFTIARLPRGSDYEISIDAERVQPYRDTVLEPAGGELDMGDLYLDRFYFLTGKVVSSSGVAVPNAEVAVINPNGSSNGFSFRGMAENASREDIAIAVSATTGDGTFVLKLREPGIFSVRALADGWAPHYETNVFVGAGADADVRMALTRGVEVTGVVLDVAGRPLPDASVSLFANSRFWEGQAKEIRKTDRAGRFEFRIEPRTDQYRVLVSTPNGVDVNKRFSLPLLEDLIIQMPGGATLKGRVVDVETAQPIANADIMVSLKGPGGSGMMPAYQKTLRTDSYGVFKLVGVGTGGLQSLVVTAAGYARFYGGRMSRNEDWKKMAGIKFTDGEVQLPDVPLKRGRVIEGIVLDKDSGQPISGAKVTLSDFLVGNRSVKTKSDGSYRVDDIGDRASLSASAEGYISIEPANPWMGAELPKDQDVIQRNFELSPAGSVSGVVRTKEGQSIARVLVRLTSGESGRGAWMANRRLRDLYTHTDSNGRYMIPGVPPIKFKAVATAKGFDRAESAVTTIDAGANLATLNIKLVSAARMSGMVVARGGGMVGGARITIAKDPGGDNVMSRWRPLPGAATVFTDEKGHFYSEDVPSGDLILRIEAEGLATEIVRRKNVKPGADVTGVKITMKPALTITGKLVDVEGNVVSRAWIQARHTSSPDGEPSDQVLGARVESDGTFVVRNIAEGSYTLEVNVWRMGGGGTQYEKLTRLGIAAGTEDLTLTMLPKEE